MIKIYMLNGAILCFLSMVVLIEAGTCPKYPLIRDFNFKKYLGLWYQQDKKQSGWEVPGRCWKSLYLRDPKNGQYKMRMIFENTITRREEKYDSQLSLQSPQKPSVIKYSIPLTFLEDEFQILATDYDSFSVEYKCDTNGLLDKQESVFLLTREKNPTPIILQRAYAIMHRYGIDIRKLERVDQTCGGLEFNPTTVDYSDYEYLASPEQELPENRQFSIKSHSTHDYYDAAPVPVAIEEPRRPTKKRIYFTHNPQPSNYRITIGQELKSAFQNLRSRYDIN